MASFFVLAGGWSGLSASTEDSVAVMVCADPDPDLVLRELPLRDGGDGMEKAWLPRDEWKKVTRVIDSERCMVVCYVSYLCCRC
mmetsp:Transcript_14506/g.21324  ORF Transcript_14506/g.21324 Transcript_14506/m.21324 type:complete len:84 (-) Transcript_14506:103-354(-)